MLSYRFDWPPSVNNYWGHKGSMRYVKKRAKEFRGSVVEVVDEDGAPNLKTRLAVHVELHPPNRRKFDVDNYLKPLLDAMEAADVFEDDSQIDRIIVERLPIDEAGNGCVDVTVIENPAKVQNRYDDAAEKSGIDRVARLIEFYLQNNDRDNARAVAMGEAHTGPRSVEHLREPLRPSTRWLLEVYSRRLVVATKAGCRQEQIDAIIEEALGSLTPNGAEVGSILLGDLPDYDCELEEMFSSVGARDWSIADLVAMDAETARVLQAKTGHLYRLFQSALGACDMQQTTDSQAKQCVRKSSGSDVELPFLDVERLEIEAATQAMALCERVGHAAARVCNIRDTRLQSILRKADKRKRAKHPHIK